jgi:hypothetical protein
MRSELCGRDELLLIRMFLRRRTERISDEQELVSTAQRDLNPGLTALLFASSAIAAFARVAQW